MGIVVSKTGKKYAKSDRFKTIALPLLPSQYDAVHAFIMRNKIGFTKHFRNLLDKDIEDNPERYGLTKI